jgi:hypothetical protein
MKDELAERRATKGILTIEISAAPVAVSLRTNNGRKPPEILDR